MNVIVSAASRASCVVLWTFISGCYFVETYAAIPVTKEKYEVCNQQNICVEVDPDAGATCYVNNSKDKVLWKVLGWHSPIFFSSNGEYFISGHPGFNLIGNDLDYPLLTVWKEGEKLYTIYFNQIVSDANKLKRAYSGYDWGLIHGLRNDKDIYLTTTEGRAFLIDFRTANIVEEIISDGDYQDATKLFQIGSIDNAQRIWKKLASEGHMDAQIKLAETYYSARKRRFDYDAAIYWLKKAADQGSDLARKNMEGLLKMKYWCETPEAMSERELSTFCGK